VLSYAGVELERLSVQASLRYAGDCSILRVSCYVQRQIGRENRHANHTEDHLSRTHVWRIRDEQSARCYQVQRSPLTWLFPFCPCFPVMRHLSPVTEIRVR
jgi:hypothetical protein